VTEQSTPANVESRTPFRRNRSERDSLQDMASGIGGAFVMLAALLSPFLRTARSRWGLTPELVARSYPGDLLVPDPTWSWTHGIEIGASSSRVWPWVAQIGADRGGFYSYQWLENLAGCNVRNAEAVHPEWEAKVGQKLSLHPDPAAPHLQIVAIERGKCLVASGAPDAEAKATGKPWTAASWLFFIESLNESRCRVISRYRAACSDDFATRLAFGPTLIEPVGFAMDRRMLLGIKQRAEHAS
jgi:hypothetical protein